MRACHACGSTEEPLKEVLDVAEDDPTECGPTGVFVRSWVPDGPPKFFCREHFRGANTKARFEREDDWVRWLLEQPSWVRRMERAHPDGLKALRDGLAGRESAEVRAEH
jgi:hypothetical protein